MGRGSEGRPKGARLRKRLPQTQIHPLLHGKSIPSRQPNVIYPPHPPLPHKQAAHTLTAHSTKSSAPSLSSSTLPKCAGSLSLSSGAQAQSPTTPRTSSPPNAACTLTRPARTTTPNIGPTLTRSSRTDGRTTPMAPRRERASRALSRVPSSVSARARVRALGGNSPRWSFWLSSRSCCGNIASG